MAKNFVQRGIPFDCLEREQDIGGLWNIATPSGIVYETTHLVSSISSTGFDDLPMLDEDYPEYPSHERVLGYFRDYARTFGLLDHIEFGKPVNRVAPQGDGRWEVAVAGEAQPRVYDGVVLASGHHDVPRMPAYPGTFSGEILHSRGYRSPKQLRDKRVLVVGCGNSAADIVSDAVHGGSRVFLSIRRGYWFVPKFILGFPTGDVICLRRDGAAAAAPEALAVPGRPVAGAGAAVALPHARPRLCHRPGASHHDGRDPAPGGARRPRRETGDRPLRGRPRALQGRHGRDDRHHRLRHRLPARHPLHRREPDFRAPTAGRACISTSRIPSTRGCSRRVSRRPTAACGGLPTTRAS